MANTLKLAAGSQSTYTSCGFTASDFNSLAVGSCAVMPTTAAIDNTVNLDDLLTVSFVFTVGGTTPTGGYFSLYLLPLNQDGTTYGDGTTTGSAVPGINYYVCNAYVKVGVTSGNTVTGTFLPSVPLDRVKFILGIGNNCIALNSSAAATVQYNTSVYNLNA